MKEKMSSISHKAVVPFQDYPSSYFLTITVPSPPKIRIQIPKLLAKTMQKRFNVYKEHNVDKGTHDDDHKPKIASSMRRVRSMLTNVFVKNKTSGVGRDMVKKVGLGFGFGQGNKSRRFTNDGGHDKGVRMESRVVSKALVIKRREGLRKPVRASKRLIQTQRSSGMVKSSLRKIGSKRIELRCLSIKHVDVEKEKESFELCKKRILMGSKCKPLTVSGALHYDSNGILLPEEIP